MENLNLNCFFSAVRIQVLDSDILLELRSLLPVPRCYFVQTESAAGLAVVGAFKKKLTCNHYSLGSIPG
jgi:hypothetical protein